MTRPIEHAVSGDVYIYDGEKFHHMLPPTPDQIVYLIKRADLAQSLADALEEISKFDPLEANQAYMIAEPKNIAVTNMVKIATDALARYKAA